MRVYICVKEYWIEENDGNGDVKVFIPKGSMFCVDKKEELPGNYCSFYSENFEMQELADDICF